MSKLSRWDKFWIGFLPGLLFPPLFMMVYVKLNQGVDVSFYDYLMEMIHARIFSALVAVSAIVNLIFFLFYMQKEYWRSGRGVLFATMVYGIVMVYFKMV